MYVWRNEIQLVFSQHVPSAFTVSAKEKSRTNHTKWLQNDRMQQKYPLSTLKTRRSQKSPCKFRTLFHYWNLPAFSVELELCLNIRRIPFISGIRLAQLHNMKCIAKVVSLAWSFGKYNKPILNDLVGGVGAGVGYWVRARFNRLQSKCRAAMGKILLWCACFPCVLEYIVCIVLCLGFLMKMRECARWGGSLLVWWENCSKWNICHSKSNCFESSSHPQHQVHLVQGKNMTRGTPGSKNGQKAERPRKYVISVESVEAFRGCWMQNLIEIDFCGWCCFPIEVTVLN